MDNSTIWHFIKSKLNDGKKIVLLVVAGSLASSPGRQGFKMAVSEDAESFGTIGGGIMEKDLTKFAQKFLSGNEKSAIKRLQHSPDTKLESSGLICGGTQTIIFKKFDESFLPLVEKIIGNIESRIPGKLILSNSVSDYVEENPTEEIEFDDNGEKWEYREQIGISDTAFIVGGGHVGLAVSRIMKSLGFYVVVFDHRKDVFTLKQNEFADEKIICKYDEIGKHIPAGNKTYIIIATPLHKGDSDALKSVITKHVKYLGLMGSKRKIVTIFDVLRNDGIDEKLFEKVYTPIGLKIGAETPEEIAISIAAEIIQVRNG